MRILLLIPQNVIPAIDGGKIGIFTPMRMLAEEYTVKAVVFCGVDEQVNIRAYNNLNVDTIFATINKTDTIFNIITNIGNKLPFKFKKYYFPRYKKQIIGICEKWTPDIVLCHHAHLAEYCHGLKEAFPQIRLILREHNLEYLLVQQYYQLQKKILPKLIAFWQYKKTKRFEQNCWGYFDKVAFISNTDFAHAALHIAEKGCIVYDGTNNTKSIYTPTNKSKSFLFTGSVKSYQNKFNLSTFIHTIWIPWKKQFEASAGYELLITGDKDTQQAAQLLQLPNHEAEKYGIKLLGFVDDIVLLMRGCTFFLSPTLIGAGIRIKVLEAMGLGCVIFLTKQDEQMATALKDGINVAVYADVTSFNNQFNNLTQNTTLYKSMSEQAAYTAQENFTWHIFYKNLQLLF